MGRGLRLRRADVAGLTADIQKTTFSDDCRQISDVEPGLTPPEVQTTSAEWNAAANSATLHGRLTNLGNVPQVEVGFQFREKKGGTDLSEKTEPWLDLPGAARSSVGEFSFTIGDLTPRKTYE